jgi:DNA polymerase-3 subunit delta
MAKRQPKPDLTATTPIAVLHGKERFLQDVYLRQLRDLLTEAHGADGFDTVRFDGATASPADILDEARSFGLMQQHKLIIVDSADQLVKAADDDDAPKPARGRGTVTARQALEHYAEQPSAAATLVLRADVWRGGNLDKKILAAGGAVIKCEPPSPGEAIAWAKARCKRRHNATLENDAAAILVDFVGADLGRLDTELAKLAMLEPGEPITAAKVRALTGYTRREETFWSIQATLLTGRAADSIAELRDLIETSRHDPVAIGWSYTDLARKLHGASWGLRQRMNTGALMKTLKLWGASGDAILAAARRLSPAQARDLLHACVEADRAAKSGLGDARRTLERLSVRFAEALH